MEDHRLGDTETTALILQSKSPWGSGMRLKTRSWAQKTAIEDEQGKASTAATSLGAGASVMDSLECWRRR